MNLAMISQPSRSLRTLHASTSPIRGWVGIAGVAGVALTLVAGRIVDGDRVGVYGIVHALGPLYWTGLGLIGVATVAILGSDRGVERGWAPLMWLLALHTAPALAHAHPRFPTAYVHLGFIDYIQRFGEGERLIDARFAWPGFFALFSTPLEYFTQGQIEMLIRLWPTLVTGMAALLIRGLASRAWPEAPAAAELAALGFIVLNWTGQDYFSPQSFGFLLFLVLLTLVESGTVIVRRRTMANWVPGAIRVGSVGDRSAADHATVVLCVVVIAATVVSHPLAPFFIIVTLAALAAYGRRISLGLMITAGLLFTSWFVVSAYPWWQPRIDGLIGELGSFLSNFRSGTSDRTSQASAEQATIVRIRTMVALGTFLTAGAIGAVALRRENHQLRPKLPLLAMMAAPPIAVALQSYGGEIMIRVFLFSLPAAVILIGRGALKLPTPLLVLLLLAFAPLFMIARFGNEPYELASASDRASAELAYDVAAGSAFIATDNGFAPIGDRWLEYKESVPVRGDQDSTWLPRVAYHADSADVDRVVVVFTKSQVEYRQSVDGRPAGELERFGSWLSSQPGVRVIQSDGSNQVFEIDVDATDVVPLNPEFCEDKES